MRTCPNCGHQNGENDRFCSNCGAPLATAQSEQEPVSATPPTSTPSGMPSPVSFDVPPGASVEDEWRMSSLGPPPSKKRPLWLWIVIALIGLCLLTCVGLIGFGLTDTGQRFFEDLATEAANQATQAAD
ncbi:MAG: zinc ribbon domain-containing protein [Chloroflexia bacterium]|nr:zinc ribbon domain-containing protein [Chloroflexia bacterium]